MQVTREPRTKNTIAAYDNAHLIIDHVEYHQSIIISPDIIITDWPVRHLQDLNEETLAPILDCAPELIIIGHSALNIQMPIAILQQLSPLRIGIECMNIGAASRTFNVLLSEHRRVVAGIIVGS